MFKLKIKKGFTLTEAIVSTAVMLTFMGLVTNLLTNFTTNTTTQNMKETMDMDLRKAIERLEKELMSARNIIEKHTMFEGQPGAFIIETKANQLVVEVPAYDSNNYPLFEDNGEPLCDTISIKMEDNDNIKVRRLNPDTNKVEQVPVKKLEFSLEPAPNSNRVRIYKQSVFQYYLPVLDNGEYQSTSDGTAITGTKDKIPKLFSYYTDKANLDPSCIYEKDKNNSIAEIDPECENLNKARTIKIVLLAEKNYGDKFLTGKRETEIRLRNSTN